MALKYACLSPTEYKRFNDEPDPEVLAVYQIQMQLLTGWLFRRFEVMQFEVAAAAVRIGAKISDMYAFLNVLYIYVCTDCAFRSYVCS